MMRRHPPCPERSSPRSPRLRERLRALVRERRATTSVEFAFVLGPLMALLLGSLQLSLIVFADQALQSAATDAGRQIMTGSAQESGMTQAAFQKAVCADLSTMFSCSGLMVDVESASGYGGIGTSSPSLTYSSSGAVSNKWAYSPGGPDDVVIVRVMYNWPIYLASLMPGLANQPGNMRLLVGTSVFKNEPFP